MAPEPREQIRSLWPHRHEYETSSYIKYQISEARLNDVVDEQIKLHQEWKSQ